MVKSVSPAAIHRAISTKMMMLVISMKIIIIMRIIHTEFPNLHPKALPKLAKSGIFEGPNWKRRNSYWKTYRKKSTPTNVNMTANMRKKWRLVEIGGRVSFLGTKLAPSTPSMRWSPKSSPGNNFLNQMCPLLHLSTKSRTRRGNICKKRGSESSKRSNRCLKNRNPKPRISKSYRISQF